MKEPLANRIQKLRGPVLVLGASGFIGANLLRTLLAHRQDVYGTSYHMPAWRLQGIPATQVIRADLLVSENLRSVLDTVQPMSVFNCIAYGAYSFEQDPELVYKTNFDLVTRLGEEMLKRRVHCFVHAGSSSEYGHNASAPAETSCPTPNSHYSVSKAAAASFIHYLGKEQGLACANLRLYSAYGPYEDSSRLIPSLVCEGMQGRMPPLAAKHIGRDFVYVDDVCEAFIDTAINLKTESFGESFNIGTGTFTSMEDIDRLIRDLFPIEASTRFEYPQRHWDTGRWFAQTEKAEKVLDWQASTPLEQGLAKTKEWFAARELHLDYTHSAKEHLPDTRYSVSAIIACYKDALAIPILHESLTRVFGELGIDYEIIFVNDGSPDDSQEVIRSLSEGDRHVVGISHSRNFGSQAAFRSGMEIAQKRACVLMDGDLQDPPEIIPLFVKQWRQGYDVVYGKRVQRVAPWYMRIAYKGFYRVFDRFSYLKIPHDAGDFSLMDRRVVESLLRFPERDLFLRGMRAYVGFKQIGVDYVRPERRFGTSTNNLLKNIGWAKKGILSFSNTPLNVLTFVGFSALIVVLTLGLLQLTAKLIYPELAPKGITTLLLVIMFFGSINLFAFGLIGEYIAKIFEEVKSRPHFLRQSIIRDGEIRDAVEQKDAQ
jgi:polyisoprenyl-phosphate glycosyltransferase